MILLLLGCLSAETPDGAPTDWFTPAPLAQPCTEQPPATGQRALTVDLFLAPGTDTAALAAHTRTAAAYYSRLGVRLTAGATHTIPATPMLGEGTDSAAILAPLVAFVQAHARPVRPGTVLLAVVPDLVDPTSPAGRQLDDLTALSFSPALAEQSAAETGIDLRALIGADFTPLVLMAGSALHRPRPGKHDLLLPHELGHALGLAHETAAANVMRPGRWFSCLPILTPAQIATIHGG